MARVGGTGPHGAGKTTGLRLLATEIHHDLITEKARLAAKTLFDGTPGEVPDKYKAMYQWETLILHRAATASNGSFVSDRTELDMWGYWRLAAQSPDTIWTMNRGGELEYEEICKRQIQAYDVIFLFPPNKDGVKADGARFVHGVKEFTAILEETIRKWGIEDKVYRVTSEGPENRVAEMIGVLKARRLI